MRHYYRRPRSLGTTIISTGIQPGSLARQEDPEVALAKWKSYQTRVAELKAQGLSKEAIAAQVKAEGIMAPATDNTTMILYGVGALAIGAAAYFVVKAL